MTDLIKVTPKIVNDIEFYVSNDGNEVGISISGLARLCGVDKSTISRLTNDVEKGLFQYAPKLLEALSGNVFTRCVISDNGAKIVNSKSASRIIRYFAYESKSANDTAKFSYDKFAEKGIEIWIKELTGFSQKDQDIISLMGEVIRELKELKEVTVEYKQIRNATSVILPGVDRMLDEYKDMDIKELLLTSDNKIPLYLWIKATKGCVLDNPTMHRFAHLVSGAYKSATNKEPERRTVIKGIKKDGTKKYQPNTSVYSEEEFPILEMCWKQLYSK